MAKHPEITFGDRLRRSRIDAELGVEEMAELLLCGRNAIGRWEADRNRPPARKLRRWAEIVADRTDYETEALLGFLGVEPVTGITDRRRNERRTQPKRKIAWSAAAGSLTLVAAQREPAQTLAA